MVRSIAPHNAGDQGPGAEETAGKGRELVRRLGVRLSWDELVDRILRVKGRGRRGKLGVADETAVVDAAGEVEGRVGLDAVADGNDGQLRVTVRGGIALACLFDLRPACSMARCPWREGACS